MLAPAGCSPRVCWRRLAGWLCLTIGCATHCALMKSAGPGRRAFRQGTVEAGEQASGWAGFVWFRGQARGPSPPIATAISNPVSLHELHIQYTAVCDSIQCMPALATGHCSGGSRGLACSSSTAAQHVLPLERSCSKHSWEESRKRRPGGWVLLVAMCRYPGQPGRYCVQHPCG